MVILGLGLHILIYVVVLFNAHIGYSDVNSGTANVNIDANGVCEVDTSYITINSIEYLKFLVNCTVIEGSLRMYMFSMNDTAVSFPNLREVTGHITMYKINQMTTLAKLFPNLTVIRGNELEQNFALVLYDMPDLKDIGLYSLRKISHGSVYIGNSPKLCYIDTIDWTSLMSAHFKELMETRNTPKSFLCVNICPGKKIYNPEKSKYIHMDMCPVMSRATGLSTRRLCWNSEKCQSICSPECPACMEKQTDVCCHPECAGGCSGPGADQCAACKTLNLNNTCVSSCPLGYVVWKKWRCVTEKFCVAPRRLPTGKTITHKVYRHCNSVTNICEDRCVDKCPLNFETVDETRCVQCVNESNCQRKCPFTLISDIASIESIKGCTTVNGVLIVLSNNIPNVMTKLEESFRTVKYVDDFVTILNSPDLTNLNFLRNLREIRGNYLTKNTTLSSVAVDNDTPFKVEQTEYLTSFWNYTDHKLKILNGRVKFLLNRRLCFSYIKQFVQEGLELSYNYTEYINEDLSPETNGDMAYCVKKKFDLYNKLVTSKGAFVVWPEYKNGVDDERNLLGYYIWYRVVGEHEEAAYLDSSGCQNIKWQYKFIRECRPFLDNSVSVANSTSASAQYTSCHLDTCDNCVGGCTQTVVSNKHCSHLLELNQPATRFAIYISPEVVGIPKHSVIRSKMLYVKTLPDQPSQPRHIKVVSRTTQEIVIKWDPPLKPNGNISYYLMWVHEIKLPKEEYLKRDYCENKLDRTDYKGMFGKDSVEVSPTVSNERGLHNLSQICERDCNCVEKLPDPEQKEQEIAFEDRLMMNLFWIRPPSTSNKIRRRPVNTNSSSSGEGSNGGSSELPDHVTPESVVNILANQNGSDTNHTVLPCGGIPPCPASIKNKLEIKEQFLTKKNGSTYEIRDTEFTIPHLTFFTDYKIEISACQHEFKHPNYLTYLYFCSEKAQIYVRTTARVNADNIPDNSVDSIVMTGSSQKTGRNEVELKWSQPPEPNGAILYYEVQYRRDTDISWHGPCVSQREWLSLSDQGSVLLKNIVKRDLSSSNISHNLIIDNRTLINNIKGGTILRGLPEGLYDFRVRAVSLAGDSNSSWTEPRRFYVKNTTNSKLNITIITTMLIVFGFVLLGVSILVYWLLSRNQELSKFVISENPDYWSYTYEPDEWEIPRDQVNYNSNDLLGKGSFGCVCHGLVRSVNTPATKYLVKSEDVPVAVKTYNEKATMRERHEFLQEATHMKQFRHCHHVVKLIGVVSEGVPTLILMELMGNGDLKSNLRRMRDDTDDPNPLPAPTTDQLLRWTLEIADGMHYLSSHKFVHRDLAARNCMVTSDMHVKVGDFGLARDIYYSDYYVKDNMAKLPVRWMAPECIREGYFTTLSDVWSFGVVLWEICTLGSMPFMGYSNDEVNSMVIAGASLDPPENAESYLAEIMLSCWQQKSRLRPSFEKIIMKLEDRYPEDFKAVSWYHNHAQDSAVSVTFHRNPADKREHHRDQEEPSVGHGGTAATYVSCGSARQPEEIPMIAPDSMQEYKNHHKLNGYVHS